MKRPILSYAVGALVLLIVAYFAYNAIANYYPPAEKSIIILGFDGMDADLAEKWMDEGRLPNLARLRAQGTYSRLQTTTPADTPVAWTTVATGLNPGKHNVFDFLDRDPETYMPRMALIKREEVEGQKPRVYNMKDGIPIWKTISDEGGWSTIINFPVTFPAEDFRGKMISGLGTPDLRGTWGTFTVYEEDLSGGEETEMGGNIVPVSFEGDEAQTLLYGPKEYRTNMSIRRDGNSILLSFGGKEYEMREGEWSGWADIQFEVNPLIKIKGISRFYLMKANPLSLYLMPVSMDPRDPFFRISTPEGYSNEIAQESGLYKTVGWADDTWALNDGATTEAIFLQDAYRTLEFKEKLVLEEIEKKPGLLIVDFYQTDTIQHTFYRYMDEQNPAYPSIPEEERARYRDEILRIYQRMDEMVGKVMEKADEDTTVIVMSDHGFNPFRKAVNLNTWLVENGYMKKKPGANTQYYQLNNLFGERGLFWNDVLLNESRAYSMGLGNIYINLKGREAQGIVEPEDYEAVRDEIISRLRNLRDPQTGQKVIAKVQKREELYSGPYVNNSADLIISFNPGYRVSWQTTLGGVPPEVVEPNLKKWSGDHSTLDPAQTEGVFFVNRVIELDREPTLQDINPTIRDLLNLPQNDSLDGHSLLRPWVEEEQPAEAGPQASIPDLTGYNVLFITLDATRADYISAYNENSLANTTNIDELASRSFLFENAFTGFTFTCPSHTIMMTGRYFGGTGIMTGRGDGIANIPEAFGSSDYATGASVGFGGLSTNACATGSMFSDYDTGAINEKLGVRGGLSANYTINWIKNHGGSKFFFWLHLYDAHPPGIGAGGTQENNYARSIEYVDSQVGRVLDALREEGLERKTVVVLLADHGMNGQFNNIPENRKLYDGATHVPLMIYIPGASPEGQRVSSLAGTVDLAPTLGGLLGVPYNETHGVSLVEAMGNPGRKAREEVFASYAFGGLSQDMARTEEWKYILSQPMGKGNASTELFNLPEDPGEESDLSASEPGVLEWLNSLLESYLGLKSASGFPGVFPPAPGNAPAPQQNWTAPQPSPPQWYGYWNNTQHPLDNQTLDDLRAFGYIN
ncbi:MAG: alkaline phosphatase family protein [Candidatus Micrarchaeota archaeon]